jgi:hypothetical protein
MAKRSKAKKRQPVVRIASVITPMPSRRRHRDVGTGTVAMSFAGLAMALMNYLL